MHGFLSRAHGAFLSKTSILRGMCFYQNLTLKVALITLKKPFNVKFGCILIISLVDPNLPPCKGLQTLHIVNDYAIKAQIDLGL